MLQGCCHDSPASVAAATGGVNSGFGAFFFTIDALHRLVLGWEV